MTRTILPDRTPADCSALGCGAAFLAGVGAMTVSGGGIDSFGEVFSAFVVTTARWHWFWIAVEYTGVLMLPSSWWFLGLRFAELHGHKLRWVGGTVRYGPLLLASLAWLCLVTNPWHNLFLIPHVDRRSEYQVIWYLQASMGYLQFASIQPELVRLMFGWMPSRDIPELCEAGDAAFEAFEGILVRCDEEGLLSRGVKEAGLLTWSAIHGAAFLTIDGRLMLGDPAPDTGCTLNLLHESLWSGIGKP